MGHTAPSHGYVLPFNTKTQVHLCLEYKAHGLCMRLCFRPSDACSDSSNSGRISLRVRSGVSASQSSGLRGRLWSQPGTWPQGLFPAADAVFPSKAGARGLDLHVRPEHSLPTFCFRKHVACPKKPFLLSFRIISPSGMECCDISRSTRPMEGSGRWSDATPVGGKGSKSGTWMSTVATDAALSDRCKPPTSSKINFLSLTLMR